MSRYFFDIYDGQITRDDVGLELPDFDAVRRVAMEALPNIAADEIPTDGDQRNFFILVKNEEGSPIYSASLSFQGRML